MARKKKKKQPQQHPSQLNPHSKTALDKSETVMRKVLRAYGLDPNMLSIFTKRQRQVMYFMNVESIRFRVAEGHRVQRRLIHFVSESVHRFLRTHYFGDESIGLTYLELSTYGMSISAAIMTAPEYLFTPAQFKVIRELQEVFKDDRVLKEFYVMGQHIHRTIMMLSKVNFRIYGFDWKIKNDYNAGCVRSIVYLSSEEATSIRFIHNQKERKAFRVRVGRLIELPARSATIARHLIFHTNEEPPVYLDIYIQSHALLRSKERIDIFPAPVRNIYIMQSLMEEHRLALTSAGYSMIECYAREEEDEEGPVFRLGYFLFTIQQNNLIVLTFLPLVSPGTPEGVYLQERFGVQLEDLKFLGMDKLSFFLTVDFEQIPVLKEALIATGIWNLIAFAAKDAEMKMNFSIDQKKTMMVKKFFEQKINYES
jgi:hypothetical protein